MPELSIRFTVDETVPGHPLRVALFRPDTQADAAPVAYTPPLDDRSLKNLRWYLEEYATWPTGPDYARARTLEANFEDWGRKLLDSILGAGEAVRLWQQFLDETGPKLLTIDATDPRVLRLPWELLADQGGFLFSRPVSIRRRLQQVETSAPAKTFELPVRVLVVVSRPEGSGFIPPRAVSKPLLDALDKLGDRVVTEFLYPPTLAALNARLYDETAAPVHVVHFDGHGIYDQRRSLGYLLFEDNEHKPDMVDAERLGTLLNQCGVPLMVLNACQSARQEVQEGDVESNPFASVAARLIRSGVSSVLAMNYSVLVVAARKFVEAFYSGLADGLTVGRAVDQARRVLLADPKRHRLTRRNDEGRMVEETIQLRDWFLPALYQQAEDPVVFAQDDGATPTSTYRAIPRALVDPSMPGGLPPDPPHGFHGRAREMLRLERELADRAIVVLHGFGGMGKTTLAAEVGRWFYRTGRFPGGAAFVSFEHGGSLQQLCSWVGQAVSGDPNFVLDDGDGDPVQRVADLLTRRPALVILDNFESVLGREPLMPPEELDAVLGAVWRWAQAGTRADASRTGSWGSRVLITTRSTEFNDTRFERGKHCAHVPLGGLAQADALELAGSILDNLGIDRERVPRLELAALMDHLGGHPLSLYLVLPHLRMHSPATLIERFEELLPGFISGAAKERHESLEVSLEFSLRRLGEETRAALPSLSIFQGGCMEHDMLEILEIDPNLWQATRAELEAAGLVTVESLQGVEPPYLRFHPTLLPYLANQLPPDRRPRLAERYWQRYYSMSKFLYYADSQHPHQARAIAIHELANMRRAFRLALEEVEAGQLPAEAVVDFADNIARFLDLFGRWRERDALLKQLDQLAETLISEGGFPREEFLILTRRGQVLWQQGRVLEAQRLFESLLEKLRGPESYGGIKAEYDEAATMMWLGRCLAVQSRHIQAIELHRRALAVFKRLGATNNTAHQMLGRGHTDLGDCLTAVGRFDEAQQVYEEGLRISKSINDYRAVGVTQGQLGFLALRRGDLDEARQSYQEALQTFRAMGEPQVEAGIWHQLGVVAQEERNWEEAERCYREAVRIREQIRDLPELAKSFNQLGIVSRHAGRPADSERWYLRAQKIKDQIAPHDASTLNNLAGLYLMLDRLDEARVYAERAVVIKERSDLSSQPWTTYSILAEIAERQGRTEEMKQWQRKSWDSRDSFAGTHHHLARILVRFQPVIADVVAAANGDISAKMKVESAFDTFTRNNWLIVDAIKRIWQDERDAETLTMGIDYNSRAVVLAILHRLGAPVPQVIVDLANLPAGASPGPGSGRGQQGEGFTLDQLLGMVVTACRPNPPPGIRDMLLKLTQQMSTDPNAPPGVNELGRVLDAVLKGERNPDMTGMPPELVAMLRKMLDDLG